MHIENMNGRQLLSYLSFAAVLFITMGALSSCDIYEEIDEASIEEILPDTVIIVGGEGQMKLVSETGDTTTMSAEGFVERSGSESNYLITSYADRCVYDSTGFLGGTDTLQEGDFEIILFGDGAEIISHIGVIAVNTAAGVRLAVVADGISYIDPVTGMPFETESHLEIIEQTSAIIRGKLEGTFFIFGDPFGGGTQYGNRHGTFSIEFVVPLQSSC